MQQEHTQEVTLKEQYGKTWVYFFTGTVLFYLAMAPVAYISKYFIPYDFNTDINIFGDVYYRYYVWSNYLPISQIFFYLIANMVGFIFINVVNLANTRKNPFIGGNGGFKDFKILMLCSVAFFFISGIVILRQKYDMINYCEANDDVMTGDFTNPLNDKTVIPNEIDHATAAEMERPLAKMFYTIDKMNYLQKTQVPLCKVIDDDKIFKFNYFLWTLFFFLGLQFTHLDQGILSQFTLDWQVMKNWPYILWAVFCLLIAFLVFTIGYIFYLYHTIGIALYYFLLLSFIIGYFALSQYLYKKTYSLHVHHYMVAMFVMIMACYQNYYISAVHAVFNGLLIEGACRWGFDPWWTHTPLTTTAPNQEEAKKSNRSKRSIESEQACLQRNMRQLNYKRAETAQRMQQQQLVNSFIQQDTSCIVPTMNYEYHEQESAYPALNGSGKICQSTMLV